MPRCRHEFLPRNHSEDYGHWNASNWKDLKVESNLKLIDPAIQELITLLNRKGFTTSSSCSGGHQRDMRTREGPSRHLPGYVCFSPPSRIVFRLYFAFQKSRRLFDFKAHLRVDNEDLTNEQTVDSQLEWQLKHRYCSRRKYYDELFSDMAEIAEKLKPSEERANLVRACFGLETVRAQKIVNKQQRRFSLDSAR
jgi:hypothetical protein